MGKILFWIILILAVLIGARLLARSSSSPAPGGRLRKTAKAGQADMSQAEAMVRCQHCGIHLPRSEAFMSNGKTWCGPEHARIAQDKPD
ncbi:MAG: hypothetical protein GX772_14520 [Alcaligenaceae bacterium]|nr:hypothetical protein [Alcaligenaceae bacterium]